MYKGIFIYIFNPCCFTIVSLFLFLLKMKCIKFHSFFYLLPPTLFFVYRCLSGLKVANDIMGECT